MGLTVWAFAAAWGWLFAVGLVVLILAPNGPRRPSIPSRTALSTTNCACVRRQVDLAAPPSTCLRLDRAPPRVVQNVCTYSHLQTF